MKDFQTDLSRKNRENAEDRILATLQIRCKVCNDQTLLGVGYYQDAASQDNAASTDIIFDKEIFNQDIYVTASDTV